MHSSITLGSDLGSVSAIMADALRAGVPDAQGCAFRIGRVACTRLTAGGPTAMSVDGLHAELRDGSWLVGMNHHLRSGPTCILDTDDTGIISGADLPQVAREVVGWNLDPASAGAGADLYPISDRKRIHDAFAATPLPMLTDLQGDTAMALPIFLLRAEVPSATRTLILSALAMTEHDQQAPPYRAGSLVLGEPPIEDLPELARPALAPGLALARGVISWLIESTASGCLPYDPRRCASVLRLLAWLPWPEERRRLHRLCRQVGLFASALTDLQSIDDLHQLLESAADSRLSRWRDQDGFGRSVARTVGDAAIAAIASRIGRDPRPLAGVDPGVPWTDSARNQTREGLIRWVAGAA